MGISKGVCHPNGRFYGTFCTSGAKTSCYCQKAGGPEPKIWRSSIGNAVFELKSDGDGVDVDIEVGSVGEESNYMSYLVPTVFAFIAFSLGYFYSIRKQTTKYTPLLDNKSTIEMNYVEN